LDTALAKADMPIGAFSEAKRNLDRRRRHLNRKGAVGDRHCGHPVIRAKARGHFFNLVDLSSSRRRTKTARGFSTVI
jgi:hypothetical protein